MLNTKCKKRLIRDSFKHPFTGEIIHDDYTHCEECGLYGDNLKKQPSVYEDCVRPQHKNFSPFKGSEEKYNFIANYIWFTSEEFSPFGKRKNVKL